MREEKRVAIAALADELGYKLKGAFNRSVSLAPGAYRRQQARTNSGAVENTRS